MVRDRRLVLLLRVLSHAVRGHMHEGGRRRHLSPRFCHSPRSFDGSLRCLVTLLGWKQLVTMEGCMVHAGMKSSTGNSLHITPLYSISIFILFLLLFGILYVSMFIFSAVRSYQLMSNRFDESSSRVQRPTAQFLVNQQC